MKKLLVIVCLLVSFASIAQDGKYKVTESDYDNREVEMADAMRENGKIYVVVGVIMIIFSGIIFYIIRTDGKVGKLEEEFAAIRSQKEQ